MLDSIISVAVKGEGDVGYLVAKWESFCISILECSEMMLKL